MKVSLVVPTIRQECVSRFLEAWKWQLSGVEVIIVEDNPEKSFEIGGGAHYSWKEIDAELGEDAWIIPRRTDCIRSFGFLKAIGDVIVTLDDDCFPREATDLAAHRVKLASFSRSPAWTSTVTGIKPRGIPFINKDRLSPTMISHGLWMGVADFDAVTQLARGTPDVGLENQTIPRGQFFPMCGMNLAFRREMLPCMYFLLMGKDWPYDRFGDIWCGLFAKKICDHLGYAVYSGQPYVRHERASDVWVNLKKEVPGYEVNETLWQTVDNMVLTGKTVADCYREIAFQLPEGDYWMKLGTAMSTWVKRVSA